ncbi:MAG TPA: hypothetical protein VLD63_12825 [Anaerolineales bacterium]|nr:hypothetical protein [Anaerolineales bacterium]
MPPRQPIGRVTRCSIQGFDGGIRLMHPDRPAFGGLCKAAAQQGASDVIGLIYDINIQDDELARQLAAAESPAAELRADQQFVRPIPIEIRALTVGFSVDGRFEQRLPPQPPITLAEIYPLEPDEVLQFTERLDFLPLVLAAPQLPVDHLLAACLRQAALARPESARRMFLIDAGRACARLLAGDLARLNQLVTDLGQP